MNRHYRTVKSGLKRGNLSDSFLASKYRFSPYMACEHGCSYCDGRAERYYVEGKFDTDIVIRSNLPEVLRSELGKLREKGAVSIGSGISDAYQPVEAEEKLMRRCAEVLSEFPFPVTVLTKSALILRDQDLWAAIHEKSGFMLVVSLVFADDAERQLFEPKAASVEERLEMLRAFKGKGCFTGVLAMPFIPLIADSVEAIRRLLESLEECDVDFVMPGSLTLRPGRQKDTFMRTIAHRFPERLEEMRTLYAEERQSGAPLQSYRDELHRRFAQAGEGHRKPFLVPHYVYRGRTQVYDEVNILLHHMVELFGERQIDVKPLRSALKGYARWLAERKRQYNRHRSWDYADLDRELEQMVSTGEMASLIGNEKLGAFLEDIVLNRQTFDYLDLKAS